MSRSSEDQGHNECWYEVNWFSNEKLLEENET